jgi:hypothetical protein
LTDAAVSVIPATVKFITWLLLASAATAVEPVKLPLDVGTLKTRDGKVFEGAKVTGHDAVGVKIIHSGGVARVEYARLPKDLAERFPRDREAAKEQLAKEAKDEAANDRAVNKALVKKKTPAEETERGKPDANDADDTAETDDVAVEGKPELKGDPAVRIAALYSYISRLEAGIDKTNERIRDANDKAERYTASAQFSVPRYNSGGYYTDEKAENKSRLRRAEFQRKRAAREQAKIDEAQILIADAKAQIKSLEAQIGE